MFEENLGDFESRWGRLTMSGPLYKFIGDPRALASILKGAVKFTPISELNDPSELSPTLSTDAVEASLERLRRDGYSDIDMVHLRRQERVLSRLAPRFMVVGVPSSRQDATAVIRLPLYDYIPALEALLIGAAEEISSKVGLFCLSRRYDSLPMWAHYARNAAGLVVEFRNLQKVFAGDDTGVLAQPIAVTYERERSGMTFDPQSHESLFFSKFEDWNYEQEIRVVMPLAECRRVSPAGGGTAMHLYDVPPDCVARVILGWNMPPDEIAAVHKLVTEINPSVEVLRARFVRGRVELLPA
ncbi:MAG TPA: DUF2971 domain-containing protein [Thermoanaerobaculia bacterium]